MTATDSDNSNANLFLTLESGGDLFKFATVSQDSSVVTITPRSEDSATALGYDGSSTLTFKASDGINQATVQNTFTLAFSITNSRFTSVLLQVDASSTDNQVDASTSTRTITEAGNVASSAFTPYHPGGYSWYWAGDGGDYFTITSPTSALSFGTGDFCVEMWIYPFDVSASILLDMRPSETNGSYIGGFGFISGNVGLGFNGQTSAQTGFVTSGAPVTTNKWHHIVLNRESGTSNIFVNGVREYQTTTVYNFLVGRYSLFKNAYSAGGINDGSGGYIRDYRVVKGNSVYGTGTTLTVPTAPLTAITGTSLLLFQKPYISDAVGTESISFVGGETKRVGPYDYTAAYTKADHGGSVYFDGSGDNLSMASSADFNFGSSDWTIEAWLYQTARDGSNICRWYMSGSNGGGNAIHVSINTNGTLDCGRAIGGGIITGSSTAAMKLNTWNHVVATKEGSNGYLYLNGKQVSTSGSATEQTSGDISLRIGYDTVNTVNEQFTGYMSDLQVIKGARKYTGDFTPPTSPISTHTNSVLLTCTNKNDIWDAGGTSTNLTGNLFTRSGSVASSNTQRKFSTSSSIYYTGSSPRTVHYLGPETHFRTGDFTIEGWVWFNAVNVADGVFHLRAGALANDTNGIAVGIQNNGALRCYFNTSGTSTTIASAQTWIHFAVVRNSGSSTFYIDGSATNLANISDTNDYQLTHLHTGVYYGTWPANYDLTGYIQGFRITKGLARYTSNFTPATAEFSG